MSWLMKKKTMIIGIDVTHPSPTSREGSPSIAAVVASVDDSFVQYPASLRIQKPDPGRESKEVNILCWYTFADPNTDYVCKLRPSLNLVPWCSSV